MPDAPTAALVSERLRARFPDAVIATHQLLDDDTVVVRREALKELARFLRDDPTMAFNLLTDATAVDYLTYPARQDPTGSPTRFELVYHIYSLEHNRRVRVKVPVEMRDPVVDSLVELWPAANWFEREIWDMFGIRFAGHPNLKRLLMYEEFQGHPLRKDYPVNKRQPLIGPVN